MSIEVKKNGHVWTVIMNRPEARNAMDPASADALTRTMLDFDADREARVAVLYGEGGAFCSGWDLKFVSSLAGEYPLGELDIPTARARGNGGEIPRGPLGPTRLELDKPVIAAVAGPAVAGGMELALWCDFRVMQDDAYFGVYCRRWGVPLIDGGTVRLPRIVGQGRALEIILTGRQGACRGVSAHRPLRVSRPERQGAREGRSTGAGHCRVPACVCPRGPALGYQKRGLAGARRADPGVVQRARGAGERRCGRSRALQGRPRPPRRLQEHLVKDPVGSADRHPCPKLPRAASTMLAASPRSFGRPCGHDRSSVRFPRRVCRPPMRSIVPT